MSIGPRPDRRDGRSGRTRRSQLAEVPTMRYALLILDGNTASPSPEPPDPTVAAQVMQAYSEYTQMLKDRGAYLGGEALQANPTATTVRVKGGKTIITDGPFIEAKEALGGFYLVEARDLDEALEFAAACPGATFGGAIEVRPVWEFPEESAAIPVGQEAGQPA
jgi:hypothetical protein